MKDTRLFPCAVIALLAATQVVGSAADDQKDNDGACQEIRQFAADRSETPPGVTDTPEDLRLKLGLKFDCVLPSTLLLNFVIASVPNPIETHLQLWFDRSVEAIQSAAGYSGFRFQKAWIPWDADLVREEPDLAKRMAQDDQRRLRELQPGVLLFRAPECLQPKDYLSRPECRDLVVLLVPETPTGGLAQDVFRDATEIALNTLPPTKDPDDKIPVLGPAFSGSFSSLAKIMRQEVKLKGKLQVISGTATSSAAWLEAFEGTRSSYNTTVHNVDNQFQMLFQHMDKVLNKRAKIALLTESETGTGWHFATETVVGRNDTGPNQIVYRYPREISRLRSAYGDQELKAVVGAEEQTPSFRRTLGFRLFDVGPSTDSTPVTAVNQTPLSQDVVLEEIARSMQHDQITLAGILATDVFDALFIARYLRDACPDIRLFTFDSDLLYEKAAEDFPFDGILALSTYPLIPSNQAWTNLHRTSEDRTGTIFERTLFPSRGAEGVYNAMRILLVRSKYVKDSMKEEQLAEYFDPTSCGILASAGAQQPGCATPPIWLTVVTGSGYWPLAVAPGPQNGRMVSWPAPGNVTHLALDAPPFAWRLLWVLIVLSLGWYFVSHLIACASGHGEREGFAHLNLWPDEEGWLARLCYLLVCSLSLLAFYWIYILPLVAISHYRPNPKLGLVRFLAELFFVIFFALAWSPYLRFRKGVDRSGRNTANWPDTWHYGILALSGLFVVFFAVEGVRLFPLWLDPGNPRFTQAFFMAYRSLHLYSGVSPVLPLLALLAAYYGWGRVHLKRVTMRFERLASLPVLGSGRECEELTSCQKKMERVVNEPLPRHWRTLGTFALAAGVSVYVGHLLNSFEPATFDLLVLFLLAILYALLFLTWTRLLLIWSKFRPFLEQLDRHPIRFVFSDLPNVTSISPFLHLTGRRRYVSLVAVRESLRMLARNTSDDLTAAVGRFELQVGDVFAKATKGIVVRQTIAKPLLDSLKQINAIIVDALNQGCWREGHSGRKVAAQDAGTAEGLADVLREEIIAIQYRDYIQYIVHQQQNLLVFIITGFLLSMVALHCYPFQSLRLLHTFVSVMFLMFSAGFVTVLAQADRDPILSRITKSTPDKLSGGFFLRAAGYLGVPLITVLASQFPSLDRFLFSWIQPALQAMK